MIVKFCSKLSYFIAEECYKDSIQTNTIRPGFYEFTTKQHTFRYDGSEDAFYTNGYDVIEIDFTSALMHGSNKDDILNLWKKLDHSKKYFSLWYFGEGMSQASDNFKILMDVGVKLYTSTWEPRLCEHPNYIYDVGLSFHYFHFYNGSCYTDRENVERITFDKKYKVGLYGLSKWKENDGSTKRGWRYDYINYFSSKPDAKLISYERPSIFELSQFMRNQHFSLAFDFGNCNYFLTAETHFNTKESYPYFTTEKILKAAWMELFDVNTMLITSPLHMKDLHEVGFQFANSKFIKEYTNEEITNSLHECYETKEIFKTNNFEVMSKILSENIFEKHKII